jgi:hypothetical protein
MVVDTIGRSDFTVTGYQGASETTPILHRWVEQARRQIQQQHSYRIMEDTVDIPLQPVGGNCVVPPCEIKTLLYQKIIDLNHDRQIILIPKFFRNRFEFQQLITANNLSDLLDDPGLTILFDIPMDVTGIPLATNWWAGALWLFPVIGEAATSYVLEIDYIRYQPFNISTVDATLYDDWLLSDGSDMLLWRTLMMAQPLLRDQFQLSTLLAFFAEAEQRVTRSDWDSKTMFDTPVAMDPTGP